MGVTAKKAALRFLKIRPRSVAELKEKLEQKGFDSVQIETAVGDLTAMGLLDDRAFTKAFINYRLARPFGFRRIVLELNAKGIDPGIIEEAIAQARETCNPQEVALDLAQRRWHHIPSGVDALKKKKRVMDFLLRRGFDTDVVMKVIKQLK